MNTIYPQIIANFVRFLINYMYNKCKSISLYFNKEKEAIDE